MPIYVYEDKILDGRNRYRACLETKTTPTMVDWDGRGSPVLFVASMNLHRRHMTASQWAAAAVSFEAEIAKEIAEEKREKNRAAALLREAVKRGEALNPDVEKQVPAILCFNLKIDTFC